MLRWIAVVMLVAILWLMLGRLFAMLVDQVVTFSIASLPVKAVHYDGGGLDIGSLSMTFGGLNNLRAGLCLQPDSRNRIVLVYGGKSFVLGPRTSLVDSSGRPDLDFVPEAGDEVTLSARRSLIGWPTPFEIDFMTRSPWWKRYVYYRLQWVKRSGAQLVMTWRYEQDYYSPGGWTAPLMMWNSATGLTRCLVLRSSG